MQASDRNPEILPAIRDDCDDRGRILTTRAGIDIHNSPDALDVVRQTGDPEHSTEGDTRRLDVVFALDCTESMTRYMLHAIKIAKEVIRGIKEARNIISRFALVEYRDHPAENNEFVTRSHNFTDSVPIINQWLDQCIPGGGTDGPEAVADGINDALSLLLPSEGVKICVLICDALPHGVEKKGDSHPEGCPCGLKIDNLVERMQEEHIILYTVGFGPANREYRGYFEELARQADGRYFEPSQARNALSTTIIRDVYPYT